MYNTFLEVLQAVKQKYQGVEKLSRTDQDACVYSHAYNGVGCAIGCLIPAEEAELLDREGANGIQAILDEYPDRAAIIDRHISPDIDAKDLIDLQLWHDSAENVEGFLALVDNAIANLEAEKEPQPA